MKTPLTKKQMIEEILLVVKANEIPTTGELFFELVFCSETALRKICHELHIPTA